MPDVVVPWLSWICPLTLNGSTDPLPKVWPCFKRDSGLEPNKDKSTIWTNPNGQSHMTDLAWRTGMKKADAPVMVHRVTIADDTTNNTATTVTLPHQLMRCTGIPDHVASEIVRVVGQTYQCILGIDDMTQAQMRQLFIPGWTACVVRVTARIGLACVGDLSAEIPGFGSAQNLNSRPSGEKQVTTQTT